MVELASLNIVELDTLNSVVDRLVQTVLMWLDERTDLNNVVGTILIN